MLPLRDQLPTRRTPTVTYLLIAANVAAFLWQLSGTAAQQGAIILEWGLVPARWAVDPMALLATVGSSMFLHGGLWHLLGNMLFLWVFGDNVEDALGRGRYLLFYVLAGAAAALAQIAVDPMSVVPMVGASGAIAGVLAAYGSLYPRAPVMVLNPFLPLWFFGYPVLVLPAWLIILEFFVMNLLSGLASVGNDGGGVAFFAHLGGFLAGLLLVRIMAQSPPDEVAPEHAPRFSRHSLGTPRRPAPSARRRPW